MISSNMSPLSSSLLCLPRPFLAEREKFAEALVAWSHRIQFQPSLVITSGTHKNFAGFFQHISPLPVMDLSGRQTEVFHVVRLLHDPEVSDQKVITKLMDMTHKFMLAACKQSELGINPGLVAWDVELIKLSLSFVQKFAAMLSGESLATEDLSVISRAEMAQKENRNLFLEGFAEFFTSMFKQDKMGSFFGIQPLTIRVKIELREWEWRIKTAFFAHNIFISLFGERFGPRSTDVLVPTPVHAHEEILRNLFFGFVDLLSFSELKSLLLLRHKKEAGNYNSVGRLVDFLQCWMWRYTSPKDTAQEKHENLVAAMPGFMILVSLAYYWAPIRHIESVENYIPAILSIFLQKIKQDSTIMQIFKEDLAWLAVSVASACRGMIRHLFHFISPERIEQLQSSVAKRDMESMCKLCIEHCMELVEDPQAKEERTELSLFHKTLSQKAFEIRGLFFEILRHMLSHAGTKRAYSNQFRYLVFEVLSFLLAKMSSERIFLLLTGDYCIDEVTRLFKQMAEECEEEDMEAQMVAARGNYGQYDLDAWDLPQRRPTSYAEALLKFTLR